jgi:peroxiredoxin
MSVANTTAGQEPTASTVGTTKSSSRPLFWAGVLLAFAMLPIFMLQMTWTEVLITPWYLPIGGTLAALAVIFAIGRPLRWWRVAIAVMCVALAAFEWLFLLSLTVLPEYRGPVSEGSPLPAFHAALADGTTIDASYFQQQRPTALVFFQGRWCPFCMKQLTELEAHHADFERVKANVVVVSLEGLEDAAATQRDFPHLKVVSDEKRELSTAVDLINKNFAPDGSDAAAPTILLLDGQGTVTWLHRPKRFIARPSADELVARIEGK